MIRQQVPQKNKRPPPKQGVPGSKKEASLGTEDLSPLLELILEHQLLENEFVQKQFGQQQENREEWTPRVLKFLLSFRESDNQSNLKLNTFVACLSLKGVRVDTSEVGMKIIAGRPILIEHNMEWMGAKTLRNHVEIIMKRMRNCSEEQLSKMMEQILIIEDFKGVKEKVISSLVENGKVVYVHKNGLFPNLQPEYFEGDKTKINGAIHLMEWGNNLFLVSLPRESTLNMRKIYDFQVDSSLIVQTNWTHRLSKQYGGNPIPTYEALGSNCIFKTASVNFQMLASQQISLQQKQKSLSSMIESIPRPQPLQQSVRGAFQMKDGDIQKYQTPSKTVNIVEEQRAYVNRYIEKHVMDRYRKESWKVETIYEECQVLLLGEYIVGLVWKEELIRPDFALISGKGVTHCQGCGQYPRDDHEQCPVIMKPVL